MRTLITLAAVAALSGCAIVISTGDDASRVHTAWGSGKAGNGIAASDRRAVEAVSSLEVSGSLPVVAQVGGAPMLVIEADSDLLPLIRTETRGGTLRIWSEQSLKSKTPIQIRYTAPRLSKLKASGASTVEIKGLNGVPLDVQRSGSSEVTLSGAVTHLGVRGSGSGVVDAMQLTSSSVDARLSGSSLLRLGAVSGDSARFELSGSSSVVASGSVRSLSGYASGSANIDLTTLKATDADLGASGSAHINAHVAHSLQAHTSGASSVRVYGKPQQSTISGKHVQLLN